MTFIRYSDSIDMSRFASEVMAHPATYGLSQQVESCKWCDISNTRPDSAVTYKHMATSVTKTIHFNEKRATSPDPRRRA